MLTNICIVRFPEGKERRRQKTYVKKVSFT